MPMSREIGKFFQNSFKRAINSSLSIVICWVEVLILDKLKRMKQLVEILGHANYMYEHENNEVMSNLEYDKLYGQLQQLEEELGVVLSGSVTSKVGFEVCSRLQKVNHSSPMLSLDKTKEIDKLESFLADKVGILSWKLDGLTIVCTYENGVLLQAITRGNGSVGEDVTHNFKVFSNVPLKIAFKDKLVVRGEAVIEFAEFDKINEKLDEKYKNPRNLCSGTVRQLNSEIAASRNVKFMAFSILEPIGKLKSEQLDWLSEQGFDVVEYMSVDSQDVSIAVDMFMDSVSSQKFASDGLVLTYDDIEYGASLGSTSKFPKDSIAFKWKDELKETTIKEIQWNTSRTGLINPVAVFEPIDLEGTSIERASVHNISIIEQLQLGVGDTVTVYKANMVIPQIADNLTCSGPVEIPSTCGVCGAATAIETLKSTKHLYCTNVLCSAQQLKSFVHFVSRNAMNISGLSEATLLKLQNMLTDLSSLYQVANYKQQILELDGFGEKSYTKLVDAINNSRKVHLHQFVYALGIPQVGVSTSKLLCRHFGYNLSKLQSATQEQLQQISGIGPTTATEIFNYFNTAENKDLIESLLTQIEFEEPPQLDDNSSLNGKTFVITGDLMKFSNRKELQEEIENRGGKVASAVSKKTDFLINNDRESASSKNQKAIELGIAILTEADFLKL